MAPTFEGKILLVLPLLQLRKVPKSVIFAGDVPAVLKLSASVAAGLVNGHLQAPTVINLLVPTDQAWVASARADELTMSNCAWVTLSVPELWQLAHSTGKGSVRIMPKFKVKG